MANRNIRVARGHVRIAKELVRIAKELVAFKTGVVMKLVAGELSGHAVNDMVQFQKADARLFKSVDVCVKAIKSAVEKYSSFNGRKDNDFTEWMWKRLESEYAKFVKNGNPVDSEFEKIHDAYALYLSYSEKDQVGQEASSLRRGVKNGSVSTDDFISAVKNMEGTLHEKCPNFVSVNDVDEAWKFLDGNRIAFRQGGYDVYKIENDDYDVLSTVATEPATTWCVAQKGNSGKVAFDDYGAPYYMIAKGRKPEALVHIKSGQFKDVDDDVYDRGNATVDKIAKRLFKEGGYLELTIDKVQKILDDNGRDGVGAEGIRDDIVGEYGCEGMQDLVRLNESEMENIVLLECIDPYGESYIDDLLDIIDKAKSRNELDHILDIADENGYDDPEDEDAICYAIFDKGLDGWKSLALSSTSIPHDCLVKMFEKGDDELLDMLSVHSHLDGDCIRILAERGKYDRIMTALKYGNCKYGSTPELMRIATDAGNAEMTSAICKHRACAIMQQDKNLVIEFINAIPAESQAILFQNLVPWIGVVAGMEEESIMHLFQKCKGSSLVDWKEVLKQLRETCDYRRPDWKLAEKMIRELEQHE